MQIVSICMKCQILFSGKNKKNISKCRLLKILPRVLSVKAKKYIAEQTNKALFALIKKSRSLILSFDLQIQSTLVISNSKGLSEILRDIRSSTYQVCRIEEKRI